MKNYSAQMALVLRYGLSVGVSLVWLVAALLKLGLNRWQLLWPQPALSIVLLVVGWQIGWKFLELDKFVGGLLRGNAQVTEFLVHWKSGLRNVVTMSVLAVLGFWLVSSSNSVLAWGVVMGVQARLLGEFTLTNEYKKWYEIVGRSFNERENMGIKIGFWGLLVVQLFFLIRG